MVLTHIHWFNPENDLALAADTPNYTPKKAAQLLHTSGDVLPLWYGAPGDHVLCYGVNANWYDRMCRDFGIEVETFDHTPLPGQVPDPWGWSKYTRRFFADEGFADDVLPTPEAIERMRRLSHRRTAIAVAERVKELLPDDPIAGLAQEMCDIDEVEAWLAVHPRCYIKHPWSGSGRGVMDTPTAGMTAAVKFADDAIRRQGSVMIETAYDRVLDFARLFRCDGGVCMDLGTSVFSTDEHNVYSGNVIASEAVRASMVNTHLSAGLLDRLSAALREAITELVAPYYDGVLGVDMVVDKFGTVAVVEINLRKTMGFVANAFSDRCLADGAIGSLRILPASQASESAYTLSDHRLASGVLNLNQPNTPLAIQIAIDPAVSQASTYGDSESHMDSHA